MLGTSPILGQALEHAWDKPALGTGPLTCLGHAGSLFLRIGYPGTISALPAPTVFQHHLPVDLLIRFDLPSCTSLFSLHPVMYHTPCMVPTSCCTGQHQLPCFCSSLLIVFISTA